ncbi:MULTISPECIES: hypothetical protein [unclassified Streptomyces]|uniref:hypothetical protein n=1 Tax=unclassified Streptomyces TaxID=2593676 RepID=UPI002E326BC2|nr:MULTISPECIES: hypothetical protein [unclassified Streptomyces]
MLPGESGPASGTTSSWASGMSGTAREAAGDVVTELSSFTRFRKRVDDLIRELGGSAAGPRRVGQEPLVRHQFGGGASAWTEASGLFSSYGTVITELETLSKLLSDSMEGMNIAVLAAHKGYRNVDLDIRDRMRAIAVATTQHYGGEYDPILPKGHDSDSDSDGDGDGGAKPDRAAASGGSGGSI